MKLKNFFAANVAAIVLLFSACNSGETPKTESTVDTSTQKMETTPVKPGNTLIVLHKVSNYAKWRPLFDSDDSARQANYLTKIAIGRGMEDSNMILAAFRMPDTAKAMAFANSPALKNKMAKAGVAGAPTILYFDVAFQDTAATSSLPQRVIVTHKVKDWNAWKQEFDSHKQARIDAGLLDRAYGHNLNDDHSVIVVCCITDMTKAKAFFQSADLKEKMKKAGVEGEPKTFFYNVVQ